MKKILAAIAILLCVPALAQNGWRDQKGNAVPNTDDRKSVNDFGGSILITSDVDWQTKWETPSDTVPNFNQAKTVTKGKKIFILTFFANPQKDSAGNVNITCDIDVLKPDKTVSLHQADMTCFKGKFDVNPYHTYLAAPVIGFSGDPEDPSGKWTVKMVLKDNVRKVAVPLKTTFILQ